MLSDIGTVELVERGAESTAVAVDAADIVGEEAISETVPRSQGFGGEPIAANVEPVCVVARSRLRR